MRFQKEKRAQVNKEILSFSQNNCRSESWAE